MPKPDLKAAAARVAEVARKTGGVFVFATRDANLPSGENVSAEIAGYPFAEHTCKECATVFSALKADGLKNHCITCGGETTAASDAETKPNIPTDNELAYLTCGSCGTAAVFASAIGKEVAKNMKCTACGDCLHVTAADEYADEDVDDTLDLDDMEMLDLDGDDDAEIADTTQGPIAGPASGLPDAGKSPGKPPESTQVDTPVTDANQTAPSEPGAGDPPQVCSLAMTDTIGTDESVSFAFMGKQVAMIAGDKIVAKLSPEDAGDHADIMQTQAFVQSVAHTINTQGLQAAIAHYKFKPVVVQVPVKAMIDKAVEARLADDKKAVTAALDESAKQLAHATDIAAAGYASNFWRNKADPVKAALIAELSSLGIQNAQRVVDRVFAAHGVAQMRDVITLARELSEKPVEALNALAQAIDLAKYLPAQVKASDDEDGDDDENGDDGDDDAEESAITQIATTFDLDDSVQTASVSDTFRFKDKTLANLVGDQPLF